MSTPELTVVVPTFNEHDNIVPLLDLLSAALTGIAWEVIFVDDDSPDGTAAVATGQALGSTGADVLVAQVAGSEAVARLGSVASGDWHERGIHPTADFTACSRRSRRTQSGCSARGRRTGFWSLISSRGR